METTPKHEPLPALSPDIPWLRAFQQGITDQFSLSPAGSALFRYRRVPQGTRSISAFILDLLSNECFDVLAAVFEARPFALHKLKLRTRYTNEDAEIFWNPFFELLGRELCRSDDPEPMFIEFRGFRFDLFASRLLATSIAPASRPFSLSFDSCTFEGGGDAWVLDAAAQSPQLQSLSLVLGHDARALSGRVLKLLRNHGQLKRLTLVCPSEEVASQFVKIVRGNEGLEHLRVRLIDSACQVEMLHALQGHPSLKSLELECILREGVEALESLSTLPALRALRLYDIQDGTVLPAGMFAGLKTLTIDNPYETQAREPSLSILGQLVVGCSKLKQLEWRNPRLLPEDRGTLEQWLAASRKLEVLKMTKLGEEAREIVLDALAGNTSLASFEVRA